MKKSEFVHERAWSEDKLQQKCFLWFTNGYPQYRGLLFSVPNGIVMQNEDGDRNWAMIKRFKQTGMYSGVSDLIFLFNRVCYLIEMKEPNGEGSQSPAQKDWQRQVESQGFEYKLMNSFEEFKKFIIFVTSQEPKVRKYA